MVSVDFGESTYSMWCVNGHSAPGEEKVKLYGKLYIK